MSNYKKYEDSIKQMIIKSGNPNLFPELKIPRSTAMYWINGSKKKVTLNGISKGQAYEARIKKLKEEIECLKAKELATKELFKNIDGLSELIKKKGNRKAIVETGLKFQRWLPIAEFSRLLSIHPSCFYRYKVEVLGCERISFKKCKIQAPNQITYKEQEMMFELALKPELSHMSLRTLCFYALREKLVGCGYDTWRKYVGKMRAEKFTRSKVKRKQKKGVRANKPNELWHMDITEFRTKEGTKVYLQVVMDNFSRKIIAWTISSSKNFMISIRTMTAALRKGLPKSILTDGGGENISKRFNVFIMAEISNPGLQKKMSYSRTRWLSIFSRY